MVFPFHCQAAKSSTLTFLPESRGARNYTPLRGSLPSGAQPGSDCGGHPQGPLSSFYGYEFDAPTRDKIPAAIEKAASQPNNGS